jgi:hypothetical protein
MSLFTMAAIFIAGFITTEISWYCFFSALRFINKRMNLFVVR